MTDATHPLDRILAKADADRAFRARLVAAPAAALAAEGVAVPEGLTLAVVEDTPTRVHLVLPAATPDRALSDEELDGVAGGFIRPPAWWNDWHARLRASQPSRAVEPPTKVVEL